MLAVSGSPSVRVAAVAAVRPPRPHVNITYAIEIVARPSHSAITSPAVVPSQLRSTNGSTNAESTAELAPIAPTTVNGSQPSSSSRRCVLAITANVAPAPTLASNPIGSVPPPLPAVGASPPKPSITTPTVASAVASIHVVVGTRRVRTHSSSPARIGAEPSATTVPTATPLRSVPRKNSGW